MIRYRPSLFINKANARNIAYLLQNKQITSASKLLNKLSSPLGIDLRWREDKVFTKVRWKPCSSDRAAIEISPDLPENRIEFFVNRLIFTLPLLTYYHQSSYFVPGAINLNLDDSADAPGLAFCSNRLDSILIPDAEFLQTKGYESTRQAMQENTIYWEDRFPIVFWRGSSTGVRSNDSWKSIPRIQLHRHILSLNTEYQNHFDVGVSSLTQLNDWEQKEFLKELKLKPFVPLLEGAVYRYQIDIDGNTNAWGALFQKLLMGCLVFKVQSPHQFKQWYYTRLEPYVHFVPVKSDLSDLFYQVRWALDHPTEAIAIAKKGEQQAHSMSFHSELDFAAKVIANEISKST